MIPTVFAYLIDTMLNCIIFPINKSKALELFIWGRRPYKIPNIHKIGQFTFSVWSQARKSLRLFHFVIFSLEIFRNNVNMDYSICGRKNIIRMFLARDMNFWKSGFASTRKTYKSRSLKLIKDTFIWTANMLVTWNLERSFSVWHPTNLMYRFQKFYFLAILRPKIQYGRHCFAVFWP